MTQKLTDSTSWSLETSQRVEYQAAGKRCVSFTVRLSCEGMTLRTAAQLAVGDTTDFAVALADPTKPITLSGRVAVREADKAIIEFAAGQAGLDGLRAHIRARIVPEVEKALSHGTVCVTRIHNLPAFSAEFLGGRAVAASVDPAAGLAQSKVIELTTLLAAQRAVTADLTERLAAAEASAIPMAELEPEPELGDLSSLEEENTSLITRPGRLGDDDDSDTHVGPAGPRYKLKMAALGAACFVVGALGSFIVARFMSPASEEAVAQQTAAVAPAPKVAPPTPAAKTQPAAPAAAAASAAPAPAAAADVPEPAPSEPDLADAPSPAPLPAVKHAPARKGSVARAPARKRSPEAAKVPKAAQAADGKDDAFLDSVFP